MPGLQHSRKGLWEGRSGSRIACVTEKGRRQVSYSPKLASLRAAVQSKSHFTRDVIPLPCTLANASTGGTNCRQQQLTFVWPAGPQKHLFGSRSGLMSDAELRHSTDLSARAVIE